MTSGGSDWLAGSGRAEKVDGGYRITGRKQWISNGSIADADVSGTAAIAYSKLNLAGAIVNARIPKLILKKPTW